MDLNSWATYDYGGSSPSFSWDSLGSSHWGSGGQSLLKGKSGMFDPITLGAAAISSIGNVLAGDSAARAELMAADRQAQATERGAFAGLLNNQWSRLIAPAADRQNQYLAALQQQNNPVYNEPERIRQPEPEPRDEKAEDWAARNPWFGSNKAMTESAYIIHRRLVSEGYDTQSDEYYEAIDSSIRKAHPEHFTKQKTKSTSPVAPVGRSKPATKIRLTATQVALAKRMNIPLQQYAEEFARLEKSNV